MKKKKGFTLVELLATVVILSILVLISTTIVIPAMNKAKRKALVTEAQTYLKAADQAFSFEGEAFENSECINVTDLNGEYVKKNGNEYYGVIITTRDGDELQHTINLTDGKYYIVGSDNLTKDDVKDKKPTGFAPNCSGYNPVTSQDDNNLLAYKLLMNEGGSDIDENLAIIDDRTSNVDFNDIESSTENSGLYVTEDDYGASYYYRGNVSNNWLEFGGIYWRIIRINGDGSVRLLYSGLKNGSHTAEEAAIKSSKNATNIAFGSITSLQTTTPDISGLTSTSITTTYSTGRFGNTFVGYMYNPERILSTYPDRVPNNSKRLNQFSTFTGITGTKNDYYFFKNFDMNTDCSAGNSTDENGVCTLKCRSLGTDCIVGNWNDIATDTNNYSTTAAGVYPATNPTQYIYTNDNKYSCFSTGTPVTKTNSDGTTSVYISCPLVYEIVGTVKDQPTQAKVKIHGLMSQNSTAANTNVKDSNAKKEIDLWYERTIKNMKDESNEHDLEDYLSDEIFCGDRTSPKTTFPLDTNGATYTYNAYVRLYSQKTPTLKCPDRNDSYTIGSSAATTVKAGSKGNHALKYPVGMITGDEIVFAGNKYNTANTSSYINIGKNQWSMTPYTYSSGNLSAGVIFYNSAAKLTYATVNTSYFIRPVINLSSKVKYQSGNGTEADPYKVTLETT